MIRVLRLEIVYAGDQDLCCYYTREAVETAASLFNNGELEWSIVDILNKEGARRFYELSVMLYGEENVRRNHLHAPIPSIFIDDKLIFKKIPQVEILTKVIRQMSERKNLNAADKKSQFGNELAKGRISYE